MLPIFITLWTLIAVMVQKNVGMRFLVFTIGCVCVLGLVMR